MSDFTHLDRTAQVAWAAGFFEGEGCFTLSKPNKNNRPDYLYPWIKITQHYDSECLHWFKHVFPDGIVTGPRKNQKGLSVVYQYYLGGNRAIEVIKEIRPFLTVGGKGGQVDEMLALCGDRVWKVYPKRESKYV